MFEVWFRIVVEHPLDSNHFTNSIPQPHPRLTMSTTHTFLYTFFVFFLFIAVPLRAQVVNTGEMQPQPQDSANLEAFENFRKGFTIYKQDPQKALPFLERAADQYLSSGILSRYLELANFLLYIKHTLGKSYAALKDAEKDLERSYEKAITEGNPKNLVNIGNLFNNMAILYQARGSFQKALDYLKRALEVTEQLPDEMVYLKPYDKANAHNNMGLIYRALGHHDLAIEHLEEALRLFELLDSKADKGELPANRIAHLKQGIFPARTRVNLAGAYDKKGESAKALRLLEEAQRIFGRYLEPTDPALNNMYLSFATVFARSGKAASVKKFTNKILASGIPGFNGEFRLIGRAHVLLAGEYREEGKLDSAIYHCQEAFKANSIRQVKSSSSLKIPKIEEALIWSLHSYSNFVESLKVLLLVGQDMQLQNPSVDNRRAFLETCTALDDFFLLIKQHQIVGEDKLAFFRQAESAYSIAIDGLVKLHEIDPQPEYLNRIFRYMERNKSILLSESFKETEAIAFAGMPRQLIDQKNRMQGEISELRKQRYFAKNSENTEKAAQLEAILTEKRRTFMAFRDSLQQVYPAFFVLKANSTPPSIQEVQAELSEDQLLLEYLVGIEAITVVSISPNKAHVEQLDYANDSLRRAVQAFRSRLSDIRGFSEDGEQAREELRHYGEHFYKHLLKNSLEQYEEEPIVRLYVIPDGLLSYVPLEVCLIGSAAEVPLEKWPYVMRKYAVAYGFSARIWLDQLQEERRVGNGRLLGIAPKYDEEQKSLAVNRSAQLRTVRERLGDLPGAREEVVQLDEQFEGLYLLNDAASESRFRDTMNNFGIIHLAMHGLLDDKEPMISSLIFTETGDSINDNFLYAYEIANMDLNAQLVVLSACETGLGELRKGEGVMSLGRSFMYAGTPSLMYSLWKVNDEATTKLMRYFYENLSDGAPIDVSLQYAKRRYLDQAEGLESHPFFWAGFVPLGDTRPVELDLTRSTSTWYWAFGGAALLIVVLAVWTSKRGA